MKKHCFSKRVPIRVKLSLIFLCTIFVPLILFGSFLFSQQFKALEKEASKSAQRELIQMAERMSLGFTQVKSVSNLFYLSENLSSFLETYTRLGYQAAVDIYDATFFNQYNAALGNTHFQVAAVAPDGRVFGNPMFVNRCPFIDLSKHQWHTTLKKQPSGILWTLDSTLDELFSSPGYPYVYLVRRLHNLGTWAESGTLIIGISELEIRKMYSGYVSTAQSTYLLDETNHLISYTDNLELGPVPDLPLDNLSGYSGSFIWSGDRHRLVSYHTLNATQWKLVTYSDLNALLASFSDVLNMFLLIFTLYLFASVFLSFVLAKRFMAPINGLYSNILSVKNGNMDARVHIVGNDEISEVSEQFNEMMRKIRELMENIVSEQKLKREAEIMSLQTQINPHFLYNTLASIRFMVYTSKKEDADTAILALIRLMKNTLSDSNEFVTVEKELNLLVDYIDIQKLTFSKDLTVEVSVEEHIKSCKIIKLLLQPIVENAILHGLKPKKGDCRLRISGLELDSILEFRVEDNGVGFDPALIDFHTATPDSNQRRIGMRNVHDRIVLTFGEQYGITVMSRPDEGTCVTIRVPKIISEGDYSSYEHFDR